MFIQELAQLTGVSIKTIGYCESIRLLPSPQRAENNYRQYTPQVVEGLGFIVTARRLGFHLTDIGEFLSARAEGTLPCKRVQKRVSFNQQQEITYKKTEQFFHHE